MFGLQTLPGLDDKLFLSSSQARHHPTRLPLHRCVARFMQRCRQHGHAGRAVGGRRIPFSVGATSSTRVRCSTAASVSLVFILLGHCCEMAPARVRPTRFARWMDSRYRWPPSCATVSRPRCQPSSGVVAGELVVVKPGDKIPVDGEIVEGLAGRRVDADRHIYRSVRTVVGASIKSGSFRYRGYRRRSV